MHTSMHQADDGAGTLLIDARMKAGPRRSATPETDDTLPWATLTHESFLSATALEGPPQVLPSGDPTEVDSSVSAHVLDGVVEFRIANADGAWWFDQSSVLARWWRDGLPWMPDESPPEEDTDDVLEAMEMHGGDLHVRLRVAQESLPPGERVEVQLLISRYGYQTFDRPDEIIQQLEAPGGDLKALLLLPRVTIPTP